MILTPKDIARFAYCPYLKYTNKKIKQVDYKFNLFEKCVISSIKAAEKSCLLKETDITPRKILSKWDSIWWPEAVKNKIPTKEIESYSFKASSLFVDYCKYDISGFLYPAIGIDIKSEVKVGQSILITTTDIVKINLNLPQKNMHIIGFGTIPLSIREVVLNPEIRAITYSLYNANNMDMAYTYICVREGHEKLLVTTSVLRQDEMKEIERSIKYTEEGIRRQIKTMNIWNCKECNQCQSLR